VVRDGLVRPNDYECLIFFSLLFIESALRNISNCTMLYAIQKSTNNAQNAVPPNASQPNRQCMFSSPLLKTLQINLPNPDTPLSLVFFHLPFHHFFSFSVSFTSSDHSNSQNSHRQPTKPSILTTNSFTLKGLATQSSIPAFNAVSLCSCLAFAETAIMGICVEILPSFSHIRI
jgi:hypothetical protein